MGVSSCPTNFVVFVQSAASRACATPRFAPATLYTADGGSWVSKNICNCSNVVSGTSSE